MNELDLFEMLIISALNNVENSYYFTTYNNIENFRGALQNRTGRIRDNNFERYGERVFCYEFYHQLRLLIDEVRRRTPDFLSFAKLQAEVEKMQIHELVQRLNLDILSSEYVPDFLMHSPGNADAHPFVIEVKCEHNVSSVKVMNDLKKLNEFVTRYHYQRGVFISINSNPEYISHIIEELNEQIHQLEGRENLKIICKTNQMIQHQTWQL